MVHGKSIKVAISNPPKKASASSQGEPETSFGDTRIGMGPRQTQVTGSNQPITRGNEREHPSSLLVAKVLVFQ